MENQIQRYLPKFGEMDNTKLNFQTESLLVTEFWNKLCFLKNIGISPSQHILVVVVVIQGLLT